MSRPEDITKKLKGADPELSMYIVALEKENFRLHKKVAKLQVANVTKDNEIKALQKALKGVKPIPFSMPIVLAEKNGE
jgi:hypothetical protein